MFATTETQQVADFVRDHGGDPVNIGGELLLPDGARVVLNGPIFREPPFDLRRRASARLAYAQARAKDALAAERAFHSSCVGNAEFSWPDAKLGPAPEAWRRLMSARRDIAAENAVKHALAMVVLSRKCAVDSAMRELAELKLPEPI